MKIGTNEAKNFLELYDNLKEIEFPFQTSYKLTKLHKSIEQEYKFIQDKFQNLLETYAEKDDNGNFILTNDKQSIRIMHDKIDECNQKMQELNSIELTIEDVSFNIDDFNSIKLTPKQIETLIIFIN